MKKLKIIYLLFIVTMLAGCAKDGAVGPTGPQGPSGPAGPTGTANISTSNYTAIPGAWNSTGTWWTISLGVPAVTDADNDLVEVYVKTSSVDDWWAMPVSNLLYPADNYQFSYATGSVTLWYTYSSAPSSTWSFKIIVIPPAQRAANPGVNWNNYHEVKTTFDLKD